MAICILRGICCAKLCKEMNCESQGMRKRTVETAPLLFLQHILPVC